MKFHFPSNRDSEISPSEWSRWHWQMSQSLKTIEDFSQKFNLSKDEKLAFQLGGQVFRTQTTPYYAELARGKSSCDPIRKMILPSMREIQEPVQEMDDPLGEKKNQPTPRIVHRYSDRVLFLVTDFCGIYCRYCTRKHFTGGEQSFPQKEEYEKALQYIRSHRGIREVILSGGDPLTLSDGKLDRVLFDLRQIDHIEVIRIGTRMPVVCPMRVTKELTQVIRKYHPVFLMTHFNHPRELTQEAATSLLQLVDSGIPVMNQMVMLNGVNNHPAIVQALSRRLLYLRVKPYYLFQCDPSLGTDHLRTSVENSLEIQRELWGHLSGLAMPSFSLDIPQGGGKIPLTPKFEISHEGNTRRYRGWDNIEADYISPPKEEIQTPLDYECYLNEWEELKSCFPTSL